MILGSNEDERVFNALSYVKSKIQNWLETNLEICLRIYISHHTLNIFSYDRAIALLKSLSERRGVNQIDEKEDEDIFIYHILNVLEYSNVCTNGSSSLMNMF